MKENAERLEDTSPPSLVRVKKMSTTPTHNHSMRARLLIPDSPMPSARPGRKYRGEKVNRALLKSPKETGTENFRIWLVLYDIVLRSS